MRLDVFLKRVGLVKQRSLCKQICDRGSVVVDGTKAKPGKEIACGRIIEVKLRDESLEIEVVRLPERNYKKQEDTAFYKIIKHEYRNPFL